MDERNPHAVALGRLGGLKGGKARANKLTPERRKEIARKAAVIRWKNPILDAIWFATEEHRKLTKAMNGHKELKQRLSLLDTFIKSGEALLNNEIKEGRHTKIEEQ